MKSRLLLLTILAAVLTGCGVQRLVPASAPLDSTSFASIHPDYQPLARTIAENTSYLPREGNDFRVVYGSDEKLQVLLRDIHSADSSVYVELFRINKGPVSDTVYTSLSQRAKDSLDVRLLPERFSHMPWQRFDYRKLRRSGVALEEWHPRWHPFSNLWEFNRRNHRKLTIFDGSVGYIGGRNIADKYFTEWRDEDIRIAGPVVRDLTDAFRRDWKTAGGKTEVPEIRESVRDTLPGAFRNKTMQLVLDGPAERFHCIEYSHMWALEHAQKEVYLMTPYLAPPRKLLEAMKAAARRGVDVRLLLPEDSDVTFTPPLAWTYFKDLLEAGVRVYLTGGGMLHSKVFVMDDYLYSVGSANLDFRSFRTNYESNMLIYDSEAAIARKKALLDELAATSREITIDDVRGRPFLRRINGWIIRLFVRLI